MGFCDVDVFTIEIFWGSYWLDLVFGCLDVYAAVSVGEKVRGIFEIKRAEEMGRGLEGWDGVGMGWVRVSEGKWWRRCVRGSG